MGVYSEVAKKAYLESDNLYGKHTDDYYKSKMFYGYAEVLIDAKSDSEAKYFEVRAINDFDVFKTAYKQKEDMKLNGIVLRPVGEANDFTACYTDPDTKSRLFETVRIIDGKVESCTSKEVEGEVLTEGAKEILKAIGKAIKDFLEKIIGIIKSLLGKKPNEKQEKELNETLNKAEKAKSSADNVNSTEEAENLKKEAEDINKKTEELQKEMESVAEGFKKTAEYIKKSEEEIDKSHKETEEHIKQSWESINNRHKAAAEEMKKSMENIKANMGTQKEEEQLERIKKLFGSDSSKKKDDEPIDVEYKEVEKESYNLAIDF